MLRMLWVCESWMHTPRSMCVDNTVCRRVYRRTVRGVRTWYVQGYDRACGVHQLSYRKVRGNSRRDERVGVPGMRDQLRRSERKFCEDCV